MDIQKEIKEQKEFASKMDDINFVKKQRTFFYLTNIVLIAIIFGMIYMKPVRFAVTHYKAVTDFSVRYEKVEKVSKEAAKQVLDTWSSTGEIK